MGVMRFAYARLVRGSHLELAGMPQATFQRGGRMLPGIVSEVQPKKICTFTSLKLLFSNGLFIVGDRTYFIG